MVARVLALEVDVERHCAGGGEPVLVVLGIVADVETLDVRHEGAEPVHVTLHHGGQYLVVGGHLRHAQAVDGEAGVVPVVRVAALGVELGGEVVHFGEGTGPDRLVVGEGHRVFHRLPLVLRHDGHQHQVVHHVGVDLGQVEFDLVVTQLLDTLDLGPDGALVQRLVGLDQVEGEEDVVGGEGFTIGPLDPFAQVEGDGFQIIAEGVVGGQTIDGFATLHIVEDHQRLIDEVTGGVEQTRLQEGVEVLDPCGFLLGNQCQHRLVVGGHGCAGGTGKQSSQHD